MIWKVRDKLTGLFVLRGSWRPHLSKNGTIWKQRNHLSASISNKLFEKLSVPVDLEVVQYEIVEKVVVSLQDWKTK